MHIIYICGVVFLSTYVLLLLGRILTDSALLCDCNIQKSNSIIVIIYRRRIRVGGVNSPPPLSLSLLSLSPFSLPRSVCFQMTSSLICSVHLLPRPQP